MTGRIFDIQRFCVHDGPGIRTTIFLKGCALRCRWCHNPEGVSPEFLLSFLPDRCVGCGFCFRHCPRGAHRMEDGRHVLDRSLCGNCGECARQCPAGALSVVGREASVEELLAEVVRDRPFYDNSGGGLTLSGGEPLLQIDFVEALLKAAKQEGLDCCIETSGFAEFSLFERILSDVDTFIYDVKETDSGRHREFTGVPNERILANLEQLHARGARILLRLPLVPGYNAHEPHFQGIAALARRMPRLVGAEIMPYHRAHAGKFARMGLNQDGCLDVAPPPPETVAGWRRRLRELGVPALDGK